MKKLLIFGTLLLILPLARATVTTPGFSVSYTCSGSTGPYSFTFPISAASAMTVTQNGSLLPSTSYTITPVNNNYNNGGNVTLNTACPAGQTLVLERQTPVTQTSVYTDNMPVPMRSFENSLDKLTEIAQEQSYSLSNKAEAGACPSGTPYVTATTATGVTCIGSSSGGGVTPGTQYRVTSYDSTGNNVQNTNTTVDSVTGNPTTGTAGQAGINQLLGADQLTAVMNELGMNWVPTYIAPKISPVYNVTAWGAKGDGTRYTNCSITASSNQYSCSTASFTSADVGKFLVLQNAALTGSVLTSTHCINVSGTHTITVANTFNGGESIYISGYTGGCSDLNGKIWTVYSNAPTSPTSSAFIINNGSSSTTDDTSSAAIQKTADLAGTIASVVNSTTITGAAGARSPSMSAGITNSTTTVIDGTDNSTAIQNAINAACASFSSGPLTAVGHNVPEIYFPQSPQGGEYHFGTTLTFGCGQIKGEPGSGYVRLVWDGALNGTAIYYPSTAGGNNSMSQFELTSDTNWYPMGKAIDYEQLWDSQTILRDVQVTGFTQYGLYEPTGFVNMHLGPHLRFSSHCGDAIYVKGVGQRNSFDYGPFTWDGGSSLANAQGCTVSHIVEFDNSVLQQAGGTVHIHDARIEDQHATKFAGTTPYLFAFTTDGTADASTDMPGFKLDNISLNMLGTQQIGIAGTNDATGHHCPVPIYENLLVGNGTTVYTKYGWVSGSMTWCNVTSGVSGGIPVSQPPELADGFQSIPKWNPNPGGDAQSLQWTGLPYSNLVGNSEFINSAVSWTLGSGWAEAAQCGFASANCLEIQGTGSPLAISNATAPTITVVPGHTYYVSAYIDDTGVTTGGGPKIALQSTSGTVTFVATIGKAEVVDGFWTAPAGVTSLTFYFSPYNVTLPIGDYLMFSKPQVQDVTNNPALVPYQPNYTSAFSTNQGMTQYGSIAGCAFANDGGGLTCSTGTITWASAFADSSYTVQCSVMYSSAIAGGSSTQPVLIVNATNSDSQHTAITEGVSQGSAGGYLVSTSYGATVYCVAHHS